jgi:hypothetical protein
MLGRKPVNPGNRSVSGLGRRLVVGVEDQCILGSLRGEDALLGARVVLKAAVAIQMVGRDVQNDGDGGTEFERAFQLEAGDFQH